jgi:hypothetical protein
LGVKLGTVRSRIHRGRAALRAALEHRRPGPAPAKAAPARAKATEAAQATEAAGAAQATEAAQAANDAAQAPNDGAGGAKAASTARKADENSWGQGRRRQGLVPRLRRSGGS